MKQCAHSENKHVHVPAQSWGFSVAHEAIYVCTHLENKYVHEWGGGGVFFPIKKYKLKIIALKEPFGQK
jgi:hypothetical protein